jgi:hypothetical protein
MATHKDTIPITEIHRDIIMEIRKVMIIHRAEDNI